MGKEMPGKEGGVRISRARSISLNSEQSKPQEIAEMKSIKTIVIGALVVLVVAAVVLGPKKVHSPFTSNPRLEDLVRP